ncbi:hypothetical protein D3273_18020 [Lichenibacterium minor]|uniref:Surface antigen domain-containing protein n=1 Tax=Lichenibacterium minor TaxID=2316528 RepID=A0A4Q2U670_9HYPH|nr:hypothetical protein D3273_18020 [Lichenibacterium minor]
MKRRLRCRPRDPHTDLIRPPEPNNRARHRVGGAACRCAAVALLAVATSACSLSIPISGIEADDTPTGGIDRTVALLSPSLDREDLRRARAAMAVALDPQGDGARSAWRNAQTGSHGAFTAAAPPFADHDRVCRRFSGEVTPLGGKERRLSGSACRDGDGTWVMRAGESGKA